jgi:hypothetical protein
VPRGEGLVLTYDEHHFAMPKLYGAPAYARPPRTLAEETPRPPDPDDLPLEAFRGGDDLAGLPPTFDESTHATADADAERHEAGPARLEARPLDLRSLRRFIADR